MENTTGYTNEINTKYYTGKIINIRYGIVLHTRFFSHYSHHPKMSV